MKYICSICGYVYDDSSESVPFSSLPDDRVCPRCKAPKSAFVPQNEAPAEKASSDFHPEKLEKVPSGLLSVIFSNLARGAEKQYRTAESDDLRKIADYFASAAPSVPGAGFSLVRELTEENISDVYPAVRKAASAASDRGALRACTWAEKVERIIQVILDRYEKEGEAMLDGAEVWVCSICGFVYIGQEAPPACPVCKVPDWKFEKIV